MTSNYLLDLRKEFDRMNKQIKGYEKDINLKKKDLSFMKTKIEREIQFSHNAQGKVESLTNELEALSLRQEEVRMEKKTLEHIITRMKQDQLKQKNDCRVKEANLKKKQTALKMKE